MAVEKSKPTHSEPDVVDDDEEFFSDANIKHTQISYGDWRTLRLNIDRDVFEYITSRFPVHIVNRLNTILKAYMSGRAKVMIPVKEYSSDRVKLVGHYEPELVEWVKQKPNQDGFVSLILRDFMEICKAAEARGEKLTE
jgi:hypothetical protein